MKKTIMLCLAFGLVANSFAQTTDLKKRPTLGINFSLKDFKTPIAIQQTSVSSVLGNKKISKLSEMSPALTVNYLEGITDYVDFMATLGGTFTKYPKTSTTNLTSNDGFLLDLDAQVNVKLLTDKYFFVPYLTAGVGASMYSGTYFKANMPVGGGIQLNLGDENFMYIQSIYKYGISEGAKDNLNFSLGFASPLTEKKVKTVVAPPPPPPAPVVEKDSDNDGIVDAKDKCPTVAGVAKYDGCPVPDSDKDGVNDDNDKCPKVAGLVKYQGCPIPDTDKDGINDEEDKCPKVAGVARYQGCPIPDRDNDGVNDEEDKCPDEAGVKENKGCPEIQTKINDLAKNVYFNTGGAVISAKTTKSLDSVIAIISKYKETKVDIAGHTDNVGKPTSNKTLSQKRADAIKAYFVKKGIATERINAVGYGSEQPIADNKTAKGKAENRRVEIKVTYQ